MNIALWFLCIIDWYFNKKYFFRNRYMSIWSRICTPVYKKFVRAVDQEILVFYYFKNSIKKYPKMERMHI